MTTMTTMARCPEGAGESVAPEALDPSKTETAAFPPPKAHVGGRTESEQVRNLLAKLETVGTPLAVNAAEFLRFKCATGMAINTLVRYAKNLLDFVDFCRTTGVQGIRDVTETVIMDYRYHIYDVYQAKSTRYSYTEIAKIFLTFVAIREGCTVPIYAFQGMRHPNPTDTLPDVLSMAKARELVTAPHLRKDRMFYRDRAVLEVLYGTGLRAGEVSALRWEDVDFDESTLRCRGKGDKERVVPMLPRVKTALLRWRAWRERKIHEGCFEHATPAMREKARQRVFISRRGHWMNREDVYRTVQKYAQRIGAPAIHPHTLRHCFATHLLNGGANLRVIQLLMGHSSMTTTQVYLNLDLTNLREAIRKHPLAGRSRLRLLHLHPPQSQSQSQSR